MHRSSYFLLAAVSLLAFLAACRPPARPTVGPPPPTPHAPLPSSTITASPALTPTFNPASSVTRTPAAPAICPSPNSTAIFAFTHNLQTVEKELLAYLNDGGQTDQLQTAFGVWNAGSYWNPTIYERGGRVANIDVTGDGTPEILVDVYQKQAETPRQFFIFGCEAGVYKTLAALTSRYAGQIYDSPTIRDMNLDGTPEIVISYRTGRAPNLYLSVFIFEWDGHDFRNLMAEDDTLVNGEYTIKEVGHNGPLALVMSGGQSVSPGGNLVPPEGRSVETWVWNGQSFVRTGVQARFAAPVYRFQAIRQGDAASQAGHLGLAIALYDQAIMDETLLGWNPAWLALAPANPETPAATSLPTSIPDPTERSRLDSYARYRIMLLYLIQGYDREAQIEYTLLQNESAGHPGEPYARLASAFWEEYTVRRDVDAACSQAIEYARAHAQDILAPLGSRFYGSAYPEYTPEEICPFW